MRKNITTINERARAALQITRDEYALCAYIHYRLADPRGVVSGWCNDTKQEIADFVGITRVGLYGMASRLESEGLIEVSETGAYRVTVKWIDTESECKVSLHDGVNKVDNPCKESLQKVSTKFTPRLNIVRKERESVSSAPAHTHEEDEFETVETEDQNALPPVAAAPLPGATGPGEYIPKWTDRPQVNTPEDLRHALSVFYHHHPEEWRKTRQGTPAAMWGNEKIREVVAAYCEWRLTQDGPMPNYRQHNARLNTWFKDEPYMTRRRGETAVVSVQKAYQPFNFS